MNLCGTFDFCACALLLVGAIVTLKVVRWKIRREKEKEQKDMRSSVMAYEAQNEWERKHGRRS